MRVFGASKLDKWTELRTAYQVAKLGTVSAAAEAEGVHRATINRHIDILEAELGARVFIRHARGYALTDVGADLLRVAGKTEELVNDLAGRARGPNGQLSGEVKVTTLAPLAPLVMTGIADFHRQFPASFVTFIATDNLARLEHGEAHVALRAGSRPKHPDYVVQSFGRLRFGLYAHDTYVARYGLPERVEQLSGHYLIGPGDANDRVPFRRWIEEKVPDKSIAFRSSNPSVIKTAVDSGLAMGFLGEHEALGRPDLHQVFQFRKDWAVALWLVTHVDLHRTKKVQALLACIKDANQLRTGSK